MVCQANRGAAVAHFLLVRGAETHHKGQLIFWVLAARQLYH